MKQEEVIKKTEEHIKSLLSGESSGHDWWHVYRVWKCAVHIAKGEKVDLFVVQLGALLHDIADWKLHGGDDDVGPKKAREWLESLSVKEEVVKRVEQIIKEISFKGSGVKVKLSSQEAKVVQDADRLDAIGAIGIARAFAYGGHKGREMHTPGKAPEIHKNFEQYKNNKSSTINHFYEKLLLLKNLMNTKTAKKIAEKRHNVMEKYLKEFYSEWEGKN